MRKFAGKRRQNILFEFSLAFFAGGNILGRRDIAIGRAQLEVDIKAAAGTGFIAQPQRKILLPQRQLRRVEITGDPAFLTVLFLDDLSAAFSDEKFQEFIKSRGTLVTVFKTVEVEYQLVFAGSDR